MFYIIDKNEHQHKGKDIMLMKIRDKKIIYDTKDLSLLNYVEMCLQISVQGDTIDATMIDDLHFKDPFSWKLSKLRNLGSHLLTPSDTSLKGFYNLLREFQIIKKKFVKDKSLWCQLKVLILQKIRSKKFKGLREMCLREMAIDFILGRIHTFVCNDLYIFCNRRSNWGPRTPCIKPIILKVILGNLL
jgi:hypothetical protein